MSLQALVALRNETRQTDAKEREIAAARVLYSLPDVRRYRHDVQLRDGRGWTIAHFDQPLSLHDDVVFDAVVKEVPLRRDAGGDPGPRYRAGPVRGHVAQFGDEAPLDGGKLELGLKSVDRHRSDLHGRG